MPTRSKIKNLRKQAEAFLLKSPSAIKKMPSEDLKDLKNLFEELQMHQVELEMQGEELRRSQLALEEARNEYLALYDFAPVGYLTLEEKGIITKVNLTAAAMLDMDRGGLMGKVFSSFVSREYQDVFYLHRRKLLKGGMPRFCELGMVKKDGAHFQVLMTSVVAAGNENRILTALTDISQFWNSRHALQKTRDQLEKQVEERTNELRKANEILRIEIEERKETETKLQKYFKAVETSKNLVVTVDRQYKYRMANSAFLKRYGLSRSQVIGRSAQELLGKEVFEEAIKPHLDKCFQGQHVQYERVHTYPNIGERNLEIDYFPLENRNGKIDHIVGVIRDITDRKRSEVALKQSEARAKGIFENTANGVAVYRAVNGGEDFVFVDLNMAGEEIGQVKREHVLGKSVLEIFPGVKDFGLLDLFRKVWETGKPEHHPVAFYSDDRISGWWKHYVFKLPSNEIVTVYSDVTAQKKVEEEIRRNREELTHVMRVATLGELGASLAHEINQPLTAILNNAHAARNYLDLDTPDLEEVREILLDIISDDKRAVEVIRRLRALFRKADLEKKSLDVPGLIEDTLAIIKSETIIRNISIKGVSNKALPPVIGDPVQLQQIILNLVMNAAEAMAALDRNCRKMIITAERENNKNVKIGIRDFGTGIRESNMARIFKPFYTTKREGIGMGLSISRTIIKAHGGQLWAENHPDGGAVFYFTLPTNEEK